MILWEEPKTSKNSDWKKNDWQTLRRVRNQIAHIQLELAEKAQTSQAAQAARPTLRRR